jgi:hypothetical protein
MLGTNEREVKRILRDLAREAANVKFHLDALKAVSEKNG